MLEISSLAFLEIQKLPTFVRAFSIFSLLRGPVSLTREKILCSQTPPTTKTLYIQVNPKIGA